MRTPFAEVIESSLTGWIAQSWQWDTTPTFGSLVCIETSTKTLFGIVHHIQTGSIDPSRYPFAYKKTEEELRREQPQIFEFLRTTFTCLAVGYLENKKIIYQLPPEPSKIHAFIYTPDAQNYKQFFSHQQYLHVLFGFSTLVNNIDELLLALLKHLADTKIVDYTCMQDFIEQFSLLTGNDYRRLKLFLQRVEALL